jgi:hypothetical protein
LNKPKHSLRSTLADLADAFAEAVIAAARESLFEFARSTSTSTAPRAIAAARPVRVRASAPAKRAAPPSPPARPAKRTRAARVASESAPHAGPSDQLITDPQALLAAFDTGAPALAVSYDEPARRKEPEILRPVAAVSPIVSFEPVLREGEVIVRRSAGGIVLRRRRG